MDQPTTREAKENLRGTILVVDDQETLLLVLAIMLKRAAYQPLTARNSQEALALFHRHADSIDVVLLDLHLPAESTPELFDALRALRPDLRVILMSGVPEPVALQRLTKDGVKGFLCKPFGPNELTRTIEAVLGGSVAPIAARAVGGAVLGTTDDGLSRTAPPDAPPTCEPQHRQPAG